MSPRMFPFAFFFKPNAAPTMCRPNLLENIDAAFHIRFPQKKDTVMDTKRH